MYSQNFVAQVAKSKGGRAHSPLFREWRQVYLIDFGLSKRFIDPKTNQHIPYRTGTRFDSRPRKRAKARENARIRARFTC